MRSGVGLAEQINEKNRYVRDETDGLKDNEEICNFIEE